MNRASRRSANVDTVPLWWGAVPVAIATVAVIWASLSTAPATPTPKRHTAPVQSVSYACPGGLTTTTGLIRAGATANAVALERVKTADAVAPEPPRVDGLVLSDQWKQAKTPPGSMLATVEGKDTGAVGFVDGTASAADGGGYAVMQCPQLSDSAWFTGLGSGAKHQSSLFLTNLADTPAVASVALWNEEEAIDARDAGNIVIPPFAMRRIALADIAAGEPLLSVHVRRQRGALAVGALDSSTAVFKGTELASGMSKPRRTSWLPGLPAGSVGRSLDILNPGQRTARITVHASGKHGRFVPKGLDNIAVEANRMRRIELPSSVGKDVVSLTVEATVPVVVGAHVQPGKSDFARVNAQAPWSGTSIIPLDLSQSDAPPEIILTATEKRATTVTLTSVAKNLATVGKQTITLEPRQSRRVKLSKELKVAEAVALEVDAEDSIVVSAVYRRKKLLSILNVMPIARVLSVPGVNFVGP